MDLGTSQQEASRTSVGQTTYQNPQLVILCIPENIELSALMEIFCICGHTGTTSHTWAWLKQELL